MFVACVKYTIKKPAPLLLPSVDRLIVVNVYIYLFKNEKKTLDEIKTTINGRPIYFIFNLFL